MLYGATISEECKNDNHLPAKREEIMKLSWANDWSVGNRFVDYAHKELLGIINQIVRSVVAGDVAALSEAFQLLEESLCAYFVVEENIAQALNFDFTQHRREHQNLLNKFRYIRDELMDKNGKWSKFEGKCYVASLRHCLIKHVKEDSKPLKIMLETNFYNFNPVRVNNAPV